MLKFKQFKCLQGESGLKKFDGRKHITDLYDSVWTKYSLNFLKINQRCYSCGSKSEVTDHLTPHKGDPLLFKKTDNHIPLCTKCHNTVTTKFDRNYIPANGIINKLRWLADNRRRNELDFSVRVLPRYGE